MTLNTRLFKICRNVPDEDTWFTTFLTMTSSANPQFIHLTKVCCLENPQDRPSFHRLYLLLEEIHFSNDLIDTETTSDVVPADTVAIPKHSGYHNPIQKAGARSQYPAEVYFE